MGLERPTDLSLVLICVAQIYLFVKINKYIYLLLLTAYDY